MEKSRFFREVQRLGQQYGYEVSGVTDDGKLELSHQNQYLCRVSEAGTIYYRQQNESKLKLFIPAIEDARKYVTAVAESPALAAESLDEGYVKLAEFEDSVLAGHDMGDHGYQFITWQWTYDHKGLNHGHYYDNYTAAKEDFAYRSGLAPEHHRFSEEQVHALHHAIRMVRDECDPDIAERLDQCMGKMEQAYPQLSEQQPTLEPQIGM